MIATDWRFLVPTWSGPTGRTEPATFRELSSFQAYLTARTDGRFFTHVYQPKIPMCARYLLQVPSFINGGDVRTEADLNALHDYENRFWDKGQFVVVLGWDQIWASGAGRWANGLTVRGPFSNLNNLPAFYLQYPYGWQEGGFDIGVHEFGHAGGLGHSDCTSSMAGHGGSGWVHVMAFSGDRHWSCDPSSMHWHWIYRGPDAGNLDSAHSAWCAARRGSSCPP